MNKFLFLIFLVLTLSLTVQAQTKLYTPEELKEAANYYFSMLEWNHPNPYYFCSKKEFQEIKTNIYEKLNRPLNKLDFLLTIGRINSCLDAHSAILIQDVIEEPFQEILMGRVKKNILSQLNLFGKQADNLLSPEDSSLYESIQKLTPVLLDGFLTEKNIDKDKLEEALYVLPPVELKENNLFFSGDSVNRISEINGIPTDSMISEYNKYFNVKLNPISNLNSINALINGLIITTINPPFRVKFSRTGKEETFKGVRIDKWVDEMKCLTMYPGYATPFTYEIYPSSSVAIFHIHTFEGKFYADFLKQIEEFKKEVNNQNIQSIFYDLTMNKGGHFEGYESLDIIKHDAVYLRRTETERNEKSKWKRKKINKVVLLSNLNDNSIPNNRLLFVLQGPHTTSKADYFCRIVKDNNLGILVGKSTGELTKTFSCTDDYTMPYTNIRFSIASVLVDYSDYFKSLTTEPDINWDLRNVREFTEQELLAIINYYKNKRVCIN